MTPRAPEDKETINAAPEDNSFNGWFTIFISIFCLLQPASWFMGGRGLAIKLSQNAPHGQQIVELMQMGYIALGVLGSMSLIWGTHKVIKSRKVSSPNK